MIQGTIKEISFDNFDEDFPPTLRVFDDGTSYLIFEFFPPDNDKLTEQQIDSFETVLSEVTGVKVIRDDRELFIIFSNDDEVVNKVVRFFDSL